MKLARRAALAAAALALLVFPLAFGSYFVYLANLVGIAVVIAVGLNFVMGYAGQISLGHAGFYAIGAYTTALATAAGVPFWVALPLGGVVAAAFGFLVGLPALRVSGHNLALATLAFGEIVHRIIINTPWTGGAIGMNAAPPALGPLVLASDAQFYYVTLGVTAVLLWVAYNMRWSRIGRAFVAMRDSETAAQACGVTLNRYKTLAFAVSGFYAGVAGGLYAGLVKFIDPSSFGLFASIIFLMMIVVGGMGSLLGAVLGAVFMTTLPEFLRPVKDYQFFAYGLILFVFVVFWPQGLVGLGRRARLRWAAR